MKVLWLGETRYVGNSAEALPSGNARMAAGKNAGKVVIARDA